ncbi:MAG: hypothetical protein HYZ48_05790, partial [Chlamydiales bacterium]|nr:hypothetical protein [Chlamydiales bacterium]
RVIHRKRDDFHQDGIASTFAGMHARIQAAFFHAVIQRPEFAADLPALIDPSYYFQDQRTLLLNCSLARLNREEAPFIAFRDEETDPITIPELGGVEGSEGLTIEELSERFIQAIDAVAPSPAE